MLVVYLREDVLKAIRSEHKEHRDWAPLIYTIFFLRSIFGNVLGLIPIFDLIWSDWLSLDIKFADLLKQEIIFLYVLIQGRYILSLLMSTLLLLLATISFFAFIGAGIQEIWFHATLEKLGSFWIAVATIFCCSAY